MKKNFNDAFFALKHQYEEKKKDQIEEKTYNMLKKMIKVYGYNSVCDKIALNKQNNKNNELGIFIDNIKQNIPLHVLCSQIYYLDDSILNENEEKVEDKSISKEKKSKVVFKSYKKGLIN